MSNGKTKEIITINVGGAGINLGQSTLHQYCVEEGISTNGDKECKTAFDDSLHTLFRETSNKTYKARSLFIDLDPYSINIIKNFFPYSNVLSDSNLIAYNGKWRYRDNFAAAHYLNGKEVIDIFNDRIRIMVEDCDSLEGFIINNSFGGGTGSGLTALCLERIAADFKRKAMIGFHVFLDEQRASPTHIYNSLLLMDWLYLNDYHTEFEASIVLDNTKLHKICKEKLAIKTPRFKDYNYLCNKLISNITAPWRLGMKEGMSSFCQDMVPLPGLQFLTASLGQILPSKLNNDQLKMVDDITTLTNQSTMKSNFFYQCKDFDEIEDHYMALMFNYRGKDIKKQMYDINKSVEALKINNKICFAKGICDAPSVKYIDHSPVSLPYDDIFCGDKQVTMIGNNLSVRTLFYERISKRLDIMYNQRAYIHHFVRCGIKEEKIVEAIEHLRFLVMDYEDAKSGWKTHAMRC